MFSADGHLLEDSSGLFQTQVNDFMITDQTSFQIFYKESKTSAQVLVNSREGEEREEGGNGGRMEGRRRGRDSIGILYTFF